MGLTFLLFIQENLNFYALLVVVIGIVIRIWATGYIHKNKEVTTAGPYKFLRHPLYLGNFTKGLGVALFVNAYPLVVLYIPVFFCTYYKKMKLEERYLMDKFGEQYENYQNNTPLFIPTFKNLFKKDGAKFSWKNVILNREHLNFLGVVIVIIFFIIYQNNLELIRAA